MNIGLLPQPHMHALLKAQKPQKRQKQQKQQMPLYQEKQLQVSTQ